MRQYILSLLMWLPALAMAQHTVKGIVYDDMQEPAIGAIVSTSETDKAISDNNGRFTVNMKESTGKLRVQYMGCEPYTATVKDGDNLTIRLKPDSRSMDELVVVGYGVQRKTALTASVEVIKGEEITKIPAMNIDEALGGQVAGLGVVVGTGDPSSNKEADIRIRGINGSPLLVIDGVPRFGNNTGDGETRLSDLNPDDIESISILKDAAASAVYGARAANGVILVQTKRGKSDGKVSFNYRGQFNLQEATYLPKFVNARDYAELYNKAVDATGNDTHQKYDLSLLGSNPNLYGDSNLLDYLDTWGHSTRHTVTVSGGNKDLKYFVSGGYTNQKGLYSNNSRDRFNYNVKLDATLLKGLTLAVDITGTVSNNKNSSFTTLDAAYDYSPLQVFEFTDGHMASMSGSNPLVAMRGLGGYVKYQQNYSTLSATLRYAIPHVKGLSVYAKGTKDMNKAITTNYSKPVALYTYDAVAGTTSVDANTVYPNKKAYFQQKDQHIDNALLEAGINFDHTFNEKHNVGAMTVFNYQTYSNLYMNGRNNNVSGPEVMGTALDATLNGNENHSQRASVIGRLNYGYSQRYFAEFSFRVDGSTRFSKQNRWGFFPTFSGSWVLSNERFFQDWQQKAISLVKFRASTGWLGVDASVADFSYLTNYILSPNYGYQIGGIYNSGLMLDTGNFPNEDLQWEKSHDYNFGLDMGFWNNRIQASFEYFLRYNTNMIMTAPSYLYPPTTGTQGNLPSLNFGEVKAWGWDFSITHRNNIGAFKYDVTFNIAKSQDRVLDYGDESTVTPSQRRKGGSSMVWSMYEAVGLFQSYEEIAAWPCDQDGNGNATLAPGDIKYKDQDGSGYLSEADKIYVKNSSYPDISYGASIGLSWKGLRLNVNMQGAAGYSQRLNEIYSLESNSLQKFQDYHRDNTWSPENTSAEYPRIKFASKNDNNRLESTFWIKKCNYLRVKAITLGYSVPRKKLTRAGINTLDINFTVGNPFTFSSLHNMDPESLRNYPLQRSYGLSLNFGI